jgi:hypothetical protein
VAQVVLVLLGGAIGLIVGAWAYWKTRGDQAPGPWQETRACIVAGSATALVCGAIFTALGVHKWFLGNETPWTASLFLAVCGGLCEGVLFRGRLLEQFHPNAERPPANDQ